MKPCSHCSNVWPCNLVNYFFLFLLLWRPPVHTPPAAGMRLACKPSVAPGFALVLPCLQITFLVPCLQTFVLMQHLSTSAAPPAQLDNAPADSLAPPALPADHCLGAAPGGRRKAYPAPFHARSRLW